MRGDHVKITVETRFGGTVAKFTSDMSKHEALCRIREMAKTVEAYSPPKKLKNKRVKKAKKAPKR